MCSMLLAVIGLRCYLVAVQYVWPPEMPYRHHLPGHMEFVVLRGKGPHRDWAPLCEDLEGCYELGYAATMVVEVKAALNDSDWYQPLACAIELATLNKEPSVGKFVPTGIPPGSSGCHCEYTYGLFAGAHACCAVTFKLNSRSRRRRRCPGRAARPRHLWHGTASHGMARTC